MGLTAQLVPAILQLRWEYLITSGDCPCGRHWGGDLWIYGGLIVAAAENVCEVVSRK